MKQLFIFNTYSIAAAYGIGTYIQQLTDCLIHAEIKVTIIYLRADKPCFAIEKRKIRHTYIYRIRNSENPTTLFTTICAFAEVFHIY